MRKVLLVIMILMLQIAVVNADPVDGAKAPDFTLQDQFDKTVILRQYEGQAIVLIASDKEGKPQNAVWTKAVRDSYADRVVVQGIADVSSVPFFLKGKIRSDLKKEGDSILLDWKGEVFKAYGFARGVSNIVLVDARGYIRHRASGQASPDAVEELFRKIDVLKE